MMKRFTQVVLVVLIAVLLAGCGGMTTNHPQVNTHVETDPGMELPPDTPGELGQ